MLIRFMMFLLFFAGICQSNERIEIDYIKANINSKNYNQVPQNIIIWAKFQDGAPSYFYNRPLKGHGYLEPAENYLISKVREQKIEIYVDYITSAKAMFYSLNNNYEVCRHSEFYNKIYKKLIDDDRKNQFRSYDRFRMRSFPLSIKSPIGLLGIVSEKVKYIEKYKFNGTNIYNIKGILNDKKLKTIMINGANNAISDDIFIDPIKGDFLKPEYKKRVYLFVASDAVQSTLMLNGHRMDWVDLTNDDGYYVKQLGISIDKITILPFSHVHPSEVTSDDMFVSYISCYGKNLDKIKKVIGIINNNIKNIRTNYSFWEEVLKLFAKDVHIPYEAPEKFFRTRETFKYKKEIDRGDFDYSYF